ncbi:hypothetical protein BG74_01415 [Sodalis-like endosymbiont of Proechinophthirus fluctus]|nr:hypothetical protein BG74_01415 [Sodalis-like endosymbiont of Proechinophthirus fluctus]
MIEVYGDRAFYHVANQPQHFVAVNTGKQHNDTHVRHAGLNEIKARIKLDEIGVGQTERQLRRQGEVFPFSFK